MTALQRLPAAEPAPVPRPGALTEAVSMPIQLPPGLDPAALPSVVQAVQEAVALLAQARGPQVLEQADALAELAAGRLEPQLPLVQERLERMHTVRTLLAETDWLSAEQVNALQPDPPANKSLPASDWKRRGRLFSVSHGGRELYPRYQFDAAYQPLPVIKAVLAAFGPVADAWTLAAWFHFPNGWLATADAAGQGPQPRAPKDRLDDAAALVQAAAQRGASYAA